MNRLIFMCILLLTVAACKSDKKTPAPAPAVPAPTSRPPEAPGSPGSSVPGAGAPGAPKAANPTYSQFMLNQQKEWLAKGHLTSTAGMGGGSMSGSTQNHWCAPGLACQDRVVMVHLGGGGLCTGVLIDSRVVMTNRHCVETITSSANSSFNGRLIQVLVPFKQKGVFDLKMQLVVNVIGLSPTEFSADETKPDYAFLLLRDEISGIKPVKMNFDGIQDGQTYSIYGVSPYADAEDPQAIVKRECVATYNTTVAPNFDSPLSPLVKFPDCPIGPSNSGSPIYNQQGELVGIIGGQLNPEAVHSLNFLGATQLFVVKLNKPLTHVAWGTNLACIPDVRDLSRPLPKDCDVAFSQPKTFAEISAGGRQNVLAALAGVPLKDEKFNYAIERANEKTKLSKLISQTTFLPVPVCVNPAVIKDQSGAQSVEVTQKFAAVKLRSNWTISEDSSGPVEGKFVFSYNADELKTKGSTTVEIMKGPLTLHHSKLSVCP